MAGYNAGGGVFYRPYSYAVNNVRWNWQSTNDRDAGGSFISFEGYDSSIEAHCRWHGPAHHCGTSFKQKLYNISEDTDDYTARGLPDTDIQGILHSGGDVNSPVFSNLPRGYMFGEGDGDVGVIYNGHFHTKSEWQADHDGDPENPTEEDYYENRAEHGVTGSTADGI